MSQPSRDAHGGHQPKGTDLGLLAIFTLIAVGLVLTMSAEICGALVVGRWPHLQDGLLGGSSRVLFHLADPGAAFTPRVRLSVVMYWVVVVVLLALLPGSWFLGRRLYRTIRGPQGPKPASTKLAGFLSRSEVIRAFGEGATRIRAARLHPNLSAGDLRHRPIEEIAMPLGRCHGVAIYASHEDIVAVLAGMRQGKTTGPLAAIALTHRGGLVYTTTKPADAAYFFTAPSASTDGPPVIFNPEDLGDLGTATYDPVAGCADPHTARITAQAILAQQRANGADRGIDWALLGEKLLKYLLHASALERVAGRPWGMGRVVQWAAAQDYEAAGITRVLERSPEASAWSQLLAELGRTAPETLYSIKINLHQALACWEDPGLLRRVSPGGSEELIDPAALVRDGRRLIVLVSGDGHVTPLTTALVSAVVEAGKREARQRITFGGRLDHPLMLLLDEVTKSAPVPQLPDLVTDGASQGIVVVYVLQSLEQGDRAWGSRFTTMWSATGVHIVMGRIADDKTLRVISEMTPQVKVLEKSSRESAYGGRPYERWEHAITKDEVRGIASHTALVLYGAKPMLVALPHVESQHSEHRAAAIASKAAYHGWVRERTLGADTGHGSGAP